MTDEFMVWDVVSKEAVIHQFLCYLFVGTSDKAKAIKPLK